MCFNARSICRKQEHLSDLITNKNPDVLCINETWLNDQVRLTAFLNCGNRQFSVFRHDRVVSSGGGVLIAVSDSLKSSFVTSKSFGTCECILVDVLMNDSVYLRIGCVYRPPNASLEDSLSLFVFLKSQLEDIKHYSIYGDFNLSDIDWVNLEARCQTSKEFLKICTEIGAVQCVDFATRNDNMLDLLLCSDQNMIRDILCTEPFCASDHCSISYSIQKLTKQKKSKPVKPCFKKADYQLINAYLATVNWDQVYSQCVEPEEYFAAFKNVIDYTVVNFVPFTSSNDNFKPPWYNAKLTNLRRIKQRSWQKYKKKRNIVQYAKYENNLQCYKSELLKSKCMYEKGLFENRKHNSKKFFNYIKRQTTVCSDIPCLKGDGFLASSDREKACLLSDYFGSVFTVDNHVLPDFNVLCNSKIRSFNCETRTMIKIIKKLKLSCSPGPDGITAGFLKNIVAQIADPLCKLYNVSLSSGFIPKDWKIAHVIPIYKKGDAQLPSNYRPVSLTSLLCKVLERVVRKQLISYLFDNGIIPKSQHGFLSKKSTVSNLLECLDKWTENFDKGIQTDIIYLDYSKCFDSVVHSKLLFKLQKYGFIENAYKWIKSFLIDRVQYVKVGSCLSQAQEVLSGVPQGTVLGPLLFLCFSSDIQSVVKSCHLSMYADDTKLYQRNKSTTDCNLLQKDLDNVFSWARSWQLKLNPDKTKHLCTGTCKISFDFMLNGNIIDKVDSICDIGVHIQSCLKSTNHCNQIIKKGYFNIRNMFNTFKGHKIEFYVSMYRSYIRPVLESSSQVWSPYLIGDIDNIESVQRYFTRKLPGLSGMSYKDRLSKLKLESLEERRIKADLVLYYKILYKKLDVATNSCIKTFKSHRGHDHHLYHHYSRTDIRKYYWANRIVKNWNSLSNDIVNCKSVNSFKKMLKSQNFTCRGSAL